jgi:cbb3-type cytochrome oxidase subunit 1
MLGIVIFVIALVVGGVEQGLKLQDSNVAFADSTKVMLPFLRASTTGLLFIVLANLLFALNIFVMIMAWKWSIAKAVFAFVISPLAKTEVKA